VLDAYGWSDLAPLMQVVNGNASSATADAASREDAVRALDAALLERLVALNAERAAEERRGLVRWLRQSPEDSAAPEQKEMELGDDAAAVVAPEARRRPWPKTLTDQVQAVTDVLAASPEALTESALAARFTARGPWRTRLGHILEMLVTLGRARQDGHRCRAIGS
jgi:hypothetical protein